MKAFIMLPVLLSLTAGSVKGFSPHLMTPNTSAKYKSDTLNSKVKNQLSLSISQVLLLVMFSSLQDECPLVVVVVNSWCLQTDGGFMDPRWM